MRNKYTICGFEVWEDIPAEEFYTQLGMEIEELIQHGDLAEDITFDEYWEEANEYLNKGEVYVVINEFSIERVENNEKR